MVHPHAAGAAAALGCDLRVRGVGAHGEHGWPQPRATLAPVPRRAEQLAAQIEAGSTYVETDEDDGLERHTRRVPRTSGVRPVILKRASAAIALARSRIVLPFCE